MACGVAWLAPKGNTGSWLFTKVKPCWMGSITGWVAICEAGVVVINHASHLFYKI